MTKDVKEIEFSVSPWPTSDNGKRKDCYITGWGLIEPKKETNALKYLNTVAKHGKKSCPCIHQLVIAVF